jgi:hypothetical protein
MSAPYFTLDHLKDYAQRRANETGTRYFVTAHHGEPMRALMDCPHNRAWTKSDGEEVVFVAARQKHKRAA